MTTPPDRADLFSLRSPGQILAIGMGAVASSYLVAMIVTVAFDEAPIHVVSIGANLAGMIALPLLYLGRQGVGVGETLRVAPLPPPQILWLVGITIAIVPAVLALATWNQQLVPPPPEYLDAVERSIPTNGGQWVLAILSVVVIGPLAEEIVFRGMVQQAARTATGRTAAIVFTGVVFAIWHGQQWNLASLLLVGLFLGLVFEATGSLLAPLILHAAYNLTILLIYAHGTTLPDLPTDVAAFGAVCALAVGWAAYGRLRCVRAWNDPPPDDD